MLPLLVVCQTVTAVAQTGYTAVQDPAEPKVHWDFNVFGPSPEGPFRLEVYYKLFNDGLSFRKEEGRYTAEYEVEVLVYHDGEQVTGTTFREIYAVESFPKTLSATDFLLNQLNVPMEKAGRYELVLRLRDVRSEHAAQITTKFEIPHDQSAWTCSRLEFARVIEQAHDTSQFNKSGLLVVPSVTRAYGGESQMECPVYLELYGTEASRGTPLVLNWQCVDPLGKERFDTTVRVESQGRVTPVMASLPVSHLTPGRYTVNLKVVPEAGGPACYQDDDWFEILWSMSTLLRTDFASAVEQLRYISSEAERDSLLKAPDSLRVPAWQSFWTKRDPTPGSASNEYRDEFYRRLRYTDATFTVADREGWRTDRGMIYVQLGEPDEVEEHPFDLEGYPYTAPWQLWRYYKSNLQFVFVDERGTGDYELQYPYDGEYWRRN
jgi:GWxTD domain-containing protein